MGEAIAFYLISAFILGFAVLVVTTKDTVHSVLFLVLDFLFVADYSTVRDAKLGRAQVEGFACVDTLQDLLS